MQASAGAWRTTRPFSQHQHLQQLNSKSGRLSRRPRVAASASATDTCPLPRTVDEMVQQAVAAINRWVQLEWGEGSAHVDVT
jgi:hypothetical protein